MPARRAYLSFDREDFPRRRRGSCERFVDFRRGWRSLAQGRSDPLWSCTLGVSGCTLEIVVSRGQLGNKGSILNFVGGNCSAPRLAQPCPHARSRVWGEPGTQVQFGAH